MPVASPPGRHDLVAYPSCLRFGVFFLPLVALVGLRLLFVLFFGVLFLLFFFPFSFLRFFLSFVFFALFQYIFCACRIQYDGMALHCLLPSLHYDVPGSTCVVVL